MTAEQSAAAQGQKRIHSLVVDTGPLIKNEPALSTLISEAEEIYTIPSVLSEIKVSFPRPFNATRFGCFDCETDVAHRMKPPAPESRRPCFRS